MAELKQYAAEPMAEVPEMKELIDKKMKEMAELKPCPFCSHTNIQTFIENNDDGGYVYAMVCTKCMANGPWKITEQQAIDAWNKRS